MHLVRAVCPAERRTAVRLALFTVMVVRRTPRHGTLLAADETVPCMFLKGTRIRYLHVAGVCPGALNWSTWVHNDPLLLSDPPSLIKGNKGGDVGIWGNCEGTVRGGESGSSIQTQ